MAQFLGDLAFLFELFAVAAGLLLLHRARDEAKPGLLRAAAALLLVGGVGGAVCTGYYWLRYQAQGEFGSAHGMTSMPMGGDAPMGGDMPMGGAMHGRGR
ncbi:MAG: hypothetical protein RLP09_37960 [Sandaracinaceae bacterium]|nr:hypothetical protein [Myxococcales bacterium]